MKLTPLDIRHKEFKRGMRGYADVEVDEFLDEVADEYERLFKESIDLRERVEALEEKVANYRRIEETLQKTLVSAQGSAEELKQNASKEAQLILSEAELKGRQLVNEAYSEKQSIEQSFAKLKSAEQDFRFKFRQLLQGYLKHVEEQTPAGPSAPEPDAEFARRAEAIKQAITREGAAEAPQAPAAPAPETAAKVAPEPGPAAAPVPEPSPAAAPVPETAAAPGPAEPARAGTAPADAETTQVPVAPATPEPTPAPAPAASQPTAEPAPAPRPAPEAPSREQAAPAPAPTPASAPERAAGAGRDAEPATHDDRALFPEGDDLLADVDTGVNENEFKW